MKNFEFLHNITIGQYLPLESPIHHLHPATKMLMAGLSVFVMIITGSLTAFFVAIVAVLVGLSIARIPIVYALKGITPAVPIIILLFVLQVLFASQSDVGDVLWQGWIITITKRDFVRGGIMVIRLAILILVISLFTFSTSSKEITHGIEQLFTPLRRIGFPAHELALVAAIALRFLPLLAMVAERLIKAQVSRGADFGKGKMGLFKRLYRMFPLFIPLFLAALRKAEHLILAMEARCYTGGKGRTRLVRFPFHLSDGVALIIVVAINVMLAAMHFSRVDQRLLPWLE